MTNVGNGDEDRARDVLEALIQLVSCDAPFLKPFLADIVSTTAGLSSNTELEDSTRKMSVEFLLSLAEHGLFFVICFHRNFDLPISRPVLYSCNVSQFCSMFSMLN